MTGISFQEAELKFQGVSGADLVASAIEAFPGRLAFVSSFGTESAVLLHMASKIDPAVPVIFLDTGKLFGPTRTYQQQLADHLGLTDVRRVQPSAITLQDEDGSGALWSTDPDRCCSIRKVVPLAKALEGFSAWITGRKSFQNQERTRAVPVEIQDDRLVLSPLLGWSKADLNSYFEQHALPRHPLEKEGYLSVGCYTCTTAVSGDEDIRAGRWRGRSKTECGIHLPKQKQTA
ncbi:MAG: phosphoadenylyl-sulfate reductase [Rhodospirillaceae bacterium]